MDIKRWVAEEMKQEIADFSECTIEEICAYSFCHPSTLRLTKLGFKSLRTIFTSYPFEIDRTILKAKHLLAISKTMEYPYYITDKELILFSTNDAVVIKLSGSVEKFLENSCK
jgi:hypothetical protein